MTRKNYLPKFPDSYTGESAKEYNNQKWMERNQKTTTTRCIEYLFDEKLGSNLIDDDIPYLILDMGCGTGYSSESLIANGFRVIGVDILLDMLLKAKERKKTRHLENLSLILTDINHLPFRLNSFDHIISVSAYNFITHGKNGINQVRSTVNKTAKNLYEILKRTGRIIIEFYPQNENELNLFSSSFKQNDFNGFIIKNNPNQKAGQTFLLLTKEG